ncbi:MAG TPA: VOC family protein [Miltoncostaeaceae bacterium]|nr:VOC family protein [Miltoncostaeaceae bacterium]
MPDFAPGTPSWVELSTKDPDAAVGFYGQVMGWTATEPGPVEQTGGYRMFQQDGHNVAGLMGLMQEGQPTAWGAYISVANADAIAGRVKVNGGTVIVEPMDVMDLGRMAIFADPSGAVFGIWEPRGFGGADIVNEPNSLGWFEVLTRDTESGKTFYPAVFGWSVGRPTFDGAPEDYTVWEVDGRPVGGMMTLDDERFPPGLPSHWSICFSVADCDAVVASSKKLGGKVAVEPMDMPIGRFAVLVDPQGAAFTIWEASQAA